MTSYFERRMLEIRSDPTQIMRKGARVAKRSTVPLVGTRHGMVYFATADNERVKIDQQEPR